MESKSQTESQLIRDLKKLKKRIAGLEADRLKLRQREKHLQESVKKYRTLIELASDAVLMVVPPKGEIIEANQAALKLLGYSWHELKRLKGSDIVAPEAAEKTNREWQEQVKVKGQFLLETLWVRKDRSRIPVEVSGKPLKIGGKPLYKLIARDITAHKRAEQVMRRQYDEIQVRSKILSSILKTFDLDERLNTILDEAMRFLKVEMAAVHLVVENELILRCSRGIPDRMRPHLLSLPVKDSRFVSAKPLIFHERLEEKGRIPDFAKKQKVQALAVFPIQISTSMKKKAQTSRLGIVMMASRRFEAIDEEDIKVLESMADELSLAVDHSARFYQAQQRLVRLGVLREIDRAIISRLSIKDIATITVSYVPHELGADAIAISLLNGEKSATKVFVMRFPNGSIIKEEAFSIADSLLHWFTERREAMIIHDVSQDPRIQVHLNLIRKHKLCSYLGVPLVADGKTLGILHVLTCEPKRFAEEDLEFFEILAGQVAIALKSALLFDEVREGEEKFHTMAALAQDAVILVDSEGRVGFWNKGAEKIFGYTAREALDRIYADLIIPDKFKNSFRTEFGKYQKSGRSSFMARLQEREAVRKDGTQIPVEVSTSPVKIKNERFSLEIIRDISRRKQMEEEQNRTAKRLQALWEIAHLAEEDLKVLYDKVLDSLLTLTESPYAFFGYLNEDETVLTVYSWSRQIMKNCKTQGILQEFPLARAGIWAEAIRQRKTFILNDYQADVPGKKGLPEGHLPLTRIMIVPIILKNRIVSVAGVANKDTDYTQTDVNQVTNYLTNAQIILERKRMEENLRISEHLLSEAQCLAHIGSWEWEIESDKTRISDEVYRILGRKPQEEKALVRSILDSIHPQDRESVREAFQEALSQGKTFSAEFRMVRPGGTVRFVHVRGKFYRDKKRRPEKIIGTVQDITPLKKAEQERKKGLERQTETFRKTIHALASAAEMRDSYTAGHQRRVSEMTVAIAREMGLAEERIEGLRLASMIHDIGKIVVPAEILSKPSKLTDPEFNIIKSHPKVAYDILKGIDFPWPVSLMILQHHEKLNSSGYPQGLQGEDIMLESRIMAVADVMEAMSSHRPYRPAQGIDSAIREIKQGRGILYDAGVVDAVLRLHVKKKIKFA